MASGGYDNFRDAQRVFFVDTAGNPLFSTVGAGQQVLSRPADTFVTNTAAISTGVTLTIPAPGAGVFNYLVWFQILLFAGAALTPAAAPVLVTTTGLSGNPIFSFPNAGAQGVIAGEQKYEGQAPLKAAAAAATITIVAPVLTGGIWRINAAYFQA